MRSLATILMCLNVGSFAAADIWLNEFHYDNAGGDTGEFVEIAVAPNMAALSPTSIEVIFYNGSGGAVYGSETLSLTTPVTTTNGFRFFEVPFAPIQNGSPDGIAIAVSGVVQQFLSYEGSFIATNGLANGMTSEDIGLNEPSTTATGLSLQLEGTGSTYSDFTWSGPAAESPGAVNTNQIAVPEPSAWVFMSLLGALAAVRKRPCESHYRASR